MSEERDASGSITNQNYALGHIESGSKYYTVSDRSGSVSSVTDKFEDFQSEYAYAPYGERRVISENVASEYQFTGCFFHSPSGLYLAGARQYNAALGRFLSR